MSLEDKNMENKKDDTKKYQSSEVNKKTKKTKNKNPEKKKKGKVGKIIKILIIVLLLAFIIGSGVLVGVFFGMFGDELKISKEELVIPYENSTVYDSDGNLIATLSGGTKRKCISLSEMGEYLPKAYVAIEDERFNEHRGVDVKRTLAATVTFVTHAGKSSFGGSTITQQLVKNITNDKEDSDLAGVMRKIKEMSKAIQVEEYLSKDQILELYLNLIFIGGNDINGVELGAIYYFNKKPAELSLAECAFMAGINHSPNGYNPFNQEKDNSEKIKKRTKTVLRKMLELGYINQEQHDTAKAEVENGLNFQNGDTSPTIEVSYVVEAALDQIVTQLMEERGWNQSYAETYLYSSGLKIYATQNTGIQATLEETIKQDKYWTKGKSKNKDGTTVEQNSMPTMVIMDHKTGSVVAATSAVGAKGERVTSTKIGYFNLPTKLRKSTGSSMKPISVIAPGLESKTITASTVYIDAKTVFDTPDKYTPKNQYKGYRGAMTMRDAIKISSNVPHVKALADIGVEKSIDFCKSVGLPLSGNEGLSLALGGLSDGVTVTEMAGAYSMIANDGTYIQPTFYKYVTDKDGNVVVEPKQKVNNVMSVQNAYIEKNILTETVLGSGGTATYCKIKGVDVAAKTGTTNADYDRWLCGFTPYYTAACWYGYENNAEVNYSNGNPAGRIWSEVMTKIHEDLPDAQFAKPEGVKEVTICRATGQKAKQGCGDTYTEVFTEDTIPDTCDGHTTAMTCTQTNLLCAEGCPYGEWRNYNSLPPQERNPQHWDATGENTGAAPTEKCPHNGGVDPEWLARQKQAEAEAAALQAKQEAEAAAAAQGQPQQPTTPPQETQNTEPQQPTQTPEQPTTTPTPQPETPPATNPEPTPTPTPEPTPTPTPETPTEPAQ